MIAAGLLWLPVYRTLLASRRRRRGRRCVAFLLLNPMLAFVSSSATPDSVNVPLATLAILLTYHTFVTGRHAWLATLALVACGLTKPSILLIYASLPIPALLLWRFGAISAQPVVAGGIVVARAAAISYLRALRLVAAAILRRTPAPTHRRRLRERIRIAAARHLDVLLGLARLAGLQAAAWWYGVFFGLAVCGAIVTAKRTPLETRRFAGFAALVGLGYFVCMTVGEYWYLPTAGYNFQGRHLLPASIAAAGLVLSDSRITRWTVTGWLALMNLLLMHESIVRYFAGDYAMFRASWP